MKTLKKTKFTTWFSIRQIILTTISAGAAFFAGLNAPFTFSFEETKLVCLLLSATFFAFMKSRLLNHARGHRLSLALLFFVFALISGSRLKQTINPEIKASLWARSSEKTLTTQKVDSIMKAHEPARITEGNKAHMKTKQISPKTTAALFSVLFFLGSLGAMFLAILAVFSSPFWFLFFVFLCVLFVSATLYFLFRLFKKALKRRSEQTREERKKDWLLYLKISGITLLVTIGLFLFANRGTFF